MLRRSLAMICCRLAQCDNGTARGLKLVQFFRAPPSMTKDMQAMAQKQAPTECFNTIGHNLSVGQVFHSLTVS